MAQSNQPFKRPNLSENEEYSKIPPPSAQDANFKFPAKGLPTALALQAQQIPSPPAQPTQEEINWAIQLEELVQKKGYKPNDSEMTRYQDIANRISYFQQNQNQNKQQAEKQTKQAQVVPKSRVSLFFKFIILALLFLVFWAKLSLVVAQPSYFIPRGKIYVVVKPVNFGSMYYSLNMDKVYEDKLKKGFGRNELNIEKTKNSKKKEFNNPNWFKDAQYWEDNYILALPYPNLSFL